MLPAGTIEMVKVRLEDSQQSHSTTHTIGSCTPYIASDHAMLTTVDATRSPAGNMLARCCTDTRGALHMCNRSSKRIPSPALHNTTSCQHPNCCEDHADCIIFQRRKLDVRRSHNTTMRHPGACSARLGGIHSARNATKCLRLRTSANLQEVCTHL
jgi:hypothetical protein